MRKTNLENRDKFKLPKYKILDPAKAPRRRDFRPECGYAVVAGGRDEEPTVLCKSEALE